MPKGRKATGGQAARGEDGTPTPRAAAASHAPVAFSAKKKQLATLLAKCISPAEAVGAVEQVFGAEDWVTDASSWSSSQLKSVVQLLADHVDVGDVLDARDPNGTLVAKLLAVADLAADEEEDQALPPTTPAQRKMANPKGAAKVSAGGGAVGKEMRARLATFVGASPETENQDDEEDEEGEVAAEKFMQGLKAALGGMEGAGSHFKASKGVALPSRAKSVKYRVSERVLPGVLEDASDNGMGIRSWVMTVKPGNWRNMENRKIVMNIALAMDTLLKELGSAAGELVGMEYLMRVVAALLQVEGQGGGGWKVASHLLPLGEEAALSATPAVKAALQTAILLDKLSKAQQVGK